MKSSLYYPMQYLLDSLLVGFLIGQIRPQTRTARRQWVYGAIWLLLSCIFYEMPWMSNVWLRFFYRTMVYMFWLRIVKRREYRLCLYVALLGMNCLSVCQSIFYTPLLSDVTSLKLALTRSVCVNSLLCFLIRYGAFFLGFFITAKTIPLRQIQDIAVTQWCVMMLITVCGNYTKRTLHPVFGLSNSEQAQELSIFVIFLQITLLALLIFFERCIYSERAGRELQLQEIANRYRLEKIQTVQESQTSLRALHHDMKNHLLTIQNLTQHAENERLNRYLAALLETTAEFENAVSTGNEVLDGLLVEKLRQAEKLEIQLDILMDLTEVDFLEDCDICTLFGNALDNALEACARLPADGGRQIVLRSQIAAGYLRVGIINSCAGEFTLVEGVPQTTKRDRKNHGMGLRNIQRILKKYHGVLSLDTSQPGRFALSMLIPFPGTE